MATKKTAKQTETATAKSNKDVPSVEAIIRLFGRSLDDPEVAACMEILGPQKCMSSDAMHRTYQCKVWDSAFSFGPNHAKGWKFDAFYLSAKSGKSKYTGVLPKNLDFNLGVDEVRQLFGEPMRVNSAYSPKVGREFQYTFDSFRLSAQFSPDEKSILALSFYPPKNT